MFFMFYTANVINAFKVPGVAPFWFNGSAITPVASYRGNGDDINVQWVPLPNNPNMPSNFQNGYFRY